MACSSEPGEGGAPVTGGSSDDDDDSTTGDDTTPSPTVSAGSVSATSPSSTTTDGSEGSTSGDPGTTTGIDPTDTTTGVTEPTTGVASTGSTSEGSTGGSTGAGTGGTTEVDPTGGPGDYACGPYANAYALCFYPDDLEYGYMFGLYYCQYYAGDCYGLSEECNALFDEWLACVTALDCKEYTLPPCPTELETLQTTCMCGSGG